MDIVRTDIGNLTICDKYVMLINIYDNVFPLDIIMKIFDRKLISIYFNSVLGYITISDIKIDIT